MSTEAKTKVALDLFNIGAIKFGAFKLKLHDKDPLAPLSPFYIDIRLVRSFPSMMDSLTDLYIEVMEQLAFEIMADVPTAATPIVAILSYKMGVPMVSPRLEHKEHGIASKIEGSYQPSQVCVLVDDLITRAESKLQAIEVLKNGGLQVRDIVVLIDREQGGSEQLRKAGYNCHAIFPFSEMIRLYKESDLLKAGQLEESIAYIKSQQAS